MIKLSTKGRYGLRAMIDLAQKQNGTDADAPVLMSDIARRQDVSRKYLHALLIPLKNAGLVRSTRGVKGGYSLAKPPTKITLNEILTALEGDLSIIDCVWRHSGCARKKKCSARKVWCNINTVLKDKLCSITLDQIVHPSK